MGKGCTRQRPCIKLCLFLAKTTNRKVGPLLGIDHLQGLPCDWKSLHYSKHLFLELISALHYMLFAAFFRLKSLVLHYIALTATLKLQLFCAYTTLH